MWLHEISHRRVTDQIPWCCSSWFPCCLPLLTYLLLRKLGWHRRVWKGAWFYVSLFICFVALSLGGNELSLPTLRKAHAAPHYAFWLPLLSLSPPCWPGTGCGTITSIRPGLATARCARRSSPCHRMCPAGFANCISKTTSPVKEGDLLFRIDDTRYQATLERAEAQLLYQQEAYRLAQHQYETPQEHVVPATPSARKNWSAPVLKRSWPPPTWPWPGPSGETAKINLQRTRVVAPHGWHHRQT